MRIFAFIFCYILPTRASPTLIFGRSFAKKKEEILIWKTWKEVAPTRRKLINSLRFNMTSANPLSDSCFTCKKKFHLHPENSLAGFPKKKKETNISYSTISYKEVDWGLTCNNLCDPLFPRNANLARP